MQNESAADSSLTIPYAIVSDSVIESAGQEIAVQVTDWHFTFHESDSAAFAGAYTEGIFNQHLLVPVNQEPIGRNADHKDWLSLIFLSGLVIVAFVKRFYGKRLQMLIDAFMLKRFAVQLSREDNALSQRVSIMLTLLYLISGGVILYLINDAYQVVEPSSQQSSMMVFIIMVAFFAALQIGKVIINYSLAFLFKVEKLMDDFVFNQFVINRVGSIFLFFLLFVLYYSGYSRSVGVVITAGSLFLGIYLWGIIRGISFSGHGRAISGFYIFLYFCTLEILPLIIILKLIKG
jgi:hypothetical protein